MTNSQQEFERWILETYKIKPHQHDDDDVRDMVRFRRKAWQACDARWLAKLDEGQMTGVIFRAIRNGGGICELDDANGVAKAIIEYMRGE